MSSNYQDVQRFRAEAKKGQSVISLVFIYRTRGEGGMCIALAVCQTKIRGAIGWGGISPMEAIG